MTQLAALSGRHSLRYGVVARARRYNRLFKITPPELPERDAARVRLCCRDWDEENIAFVLDALRQLRPMDRALVLCGMERK